MQAAHTILTGEAIAQLLGQWPQIGIIDRCDLLRRGFNEVYDVHAHTGRYVARLSALRARGPANLPYELALLSHLDARGVGVAAGVGSPVHVNASEGIRELAVFRHVDGNNPETLEEFEATGQGLADIHEGAKDYNGPASRYVLNLHHLLDRPLIWLAQAPTMDEPLKREFAALADAVRHAVGSGAGLTSVACHGDCHGGNNFIVRSADGSIRTVFFDFDDAGPGWLAYDLAVMLWGLLPRRIDSEIDAEAGAKFAGFLAGYRRSGSPSQADLEAVPHFVVARHIWLLGEYASRRHHWGSQAIPTAWLRKQVPLMRSWIEMRLPP